MSARRETSDGTDSLDISQPLTSVPLSPPRPPNSSARANSSAPVGPVPPPPAPLNPEPDGVPDYSDDNVLVDAHEDRWHWRRKIRANPHQLRVYRVGVAIAGLLLVVLGLVTGPIPGPGGIPLILLGLATWASEFEWAHRVMYWFKAQLHRFRSWSRLQQVGFWAVFFSVCGLAWYSFMLVTGVPSWLPASADVLLERLPGL